MKSKYIIGNKTEGEIISEFTDEMISVLESSEDIIKDTFCDLSDENLKGLKNTFEKTEDLRKKTKMLKNSINSTIKSFSVNSVEVSHHYIQMINCLRETSHCISYIVKPSMDHVDNHHKPLVALQKEELQNVYKGLEQLFNNAIKIIMAEDFNAIPSLEDRKKSLLELIDSYTKKQIKRIKANEVGTKNSLVYMKVLGETKNLILYILKLLKCNRDFINSTSRKQK
jgi:Na+/phosphate symporter